MSDIVERLRNRALAAAIIKDKPDLYYDAAHEIERLRAENETLRRDVKTAVMGDSAELADMKRENEKLRNALKPFADYSDCLNEEEEETGNLAKDYDNQPVKIHYLRAAAAAIRESGDE